MANLLIVDDDVDIADLLSQILAAAGHAVRVARDGQEGLRLVSERTPDAVVLDVEMPCLNGPEMARTLFVRDRGDELIPLILISGRPGLPQVAAKVGTPYFIAKPLEIDALLKLVARVLRERTAPAPALARPEHGVAP
jgi:two-component system, OmpR family, response regulator PrrA